ncbi:hypothetical protein KX729_26190 [Rhizobium sp. XQZ8]|uniref:hypothetical protein n=1 Tax=Rhizobium populisoli TaxID=2859785 RepID=UPI001CA5B1AB|nr:hypothetical protein [Rhizobium populisoli]MBW6424937.1 hypothetical protein [Rhizobium populisoli]
MFEALVHGAELLAGELAVFEQQLDDDLQALATAVETLRGRFDQMSGDSEDLRKAS